MAKKLRDIRTLAVHGNLEKELTRQIFVHGASAPKTTPAPKPKPAPRPKPAQVVLRPHMFLAEYYALRTYLGDMGKGDAIGTYNLLPGEEQEFYVLTRRTSERTTQITSSAVETRDEKVVEDLNTSVKEDNAASHSGEQYDYRMEASFHGDASWGPFSGDVNAEVDVRGGSNSVRDEFKSAVSTAVNKQVARTNEFRTQRMSSSGQTQTEGETHETSSKRNIKNADARRAANYVFYQLSQEYISIMSLVDVKIGFRDGDPQHDRLLPLSRLDTLLNEVLARPEDRNLVRTVVLGELSAIFDYQGEPRSVLRQKPLLDAAGNASAQSYSQFDPDLNSSYTLTDSAGAERRTIVVPGVIVKVDRRVLPTTNIGVSTLYEG